MSGYKVTKLVCENHGIFTSQNLEIDGKNMVVEGKTGKGKTTLISLLSKIINKKPNIKEGAGKETLEAFLENDNGETLYLKRSNTGKVSTPLFVDENGEKLPDKLVKGMFFDLSQDPLGLLRKTGQERYEFLLKCSDVDIKKLNALKLLRVQVAEKRKDSKSHLSYLKNNRGEQPEIFERIDIDIKQKELDGAYSHNQQIDRAIDGRENLVSDKEEKLQEIKDLKIKIKDLEKRISNADEYLKDNKKVDTEQLQKEVKGSVEINEKASQWDQWQVKNNEYLKENDGWCNLDDSVKKCDQDIKKLTETIEFPVENLTISDSDIFYNGINYNALGTSEQILISSSLVAKYIVSQKRSINLMVIDRGESMDIETQAKVIENCNKIGVQIFLSIVDRKNDKDSFKIDYLEFIK